MNRYRLVIFKAVGEVIAFEHTRDGMPRCQSDHVGRSLAPMPGRVEANFGGVRIQNLEHLCLVGFRIFPDLLGRQRRSCYGFAGGVTDHAGKIADQEHDMVAKFLELAHFID